MQRPFAPLFFFATLICAAGAQTAPVIVSQPVSVTAYAGEYPSFSVVATGSPTPSYQWFKDGEMIAGASTDRLLVAKAFLGAAGTYTVVVSNAYGGITSDAATLSVRFDAPTPGFSQQPQSISVNLGASATFSVGTSGTPIQWLRNGIPIAGATSPQLTIASVQLSDVGIYSAITSQGIAAAQSSGGRLWINLVPGASYFDSWTLAAPLPSTLDYPSLAFDGSNFLAVGSDGSLFRSPPDGSTWTPLPALPGRLNSIVFVGQPWGSLAVGDNGLIASFEAPNYLPAFQHAGTSARLTGIAAGGGRMVAVGSGGATFTSDFQFAGWTPGFTANTNTLNAVAYGNGGFVAVGSGPTVLTSPDGSIWTTRTIGAQSELLGIAYGTAGFVAIGSDSIFTSPDGITWTGQSAPPGIALAKIIYANHAFVAAGAGGKIMTSTDGGFTWDTHATGASGNLESVAYGLNSILAVGDRGVATQSAVADSRMVNLSTRAQVGSGSNNLTAGFVTNGVGPKQVLLRGVGPSLAQFGVGGALADPQLTLFDVNGASLAFGAAWGGSSQLSAVFSQVGAFALPATSADAALLAKLAPGKYTARVNAGNPASGTGMIEIYDADSGAPISRLTNLSSIGLAGSGPNLMVAGFVIAGNTSKLLLIRGIGPGLAAFGVEGFLTNPVLTLYDGSGRVIAANTVWGGTPALSAAFASAGAFSLAANSNDTALLVALEPGAYTAQVSGTGDASGSAMVEIYDEPSQ